jgi:hypothetical protein
MPDVCSVLMVAIFLVAVNPTGVDKKQGDAFVESPVDFLTAVIWYLKNIRKGPHTNGRRWGAGNRPFISNYL